MKIGKLNSRIQRLGSKARGDINKAVGKTSKVIQSVEKGAKGVVSGIEKAAQSAPVRAIQQASGIAGKLLVQTGNPQAVALGESLLAGKEGISAARKSVTKQSALIKGKLGETSGKLQSGLLTGATRASAATRKAQGVAGNALEKKAPEESGWESLPQYVD